MEDFDVPGAEDFNGEDMNFGGDDSPVMKVGEEKEIGTEGLKKKLVKEGEGWARVRGLTIEGNFITSTAIGIYLEEGAVASLADKWKGKSATELVESVEFFRDIVTVEGHSIYVRNLPLIATVAQLEQVFKTFGSIKQGGVQVRSNK